MLKHRYPDIKDMESLHSFIKELIVICCNYRVEPNSDLAILKKSLLDCLTSMLQQQSAVFIQDEQELVLLKELTEFYKIEIYTWKHSELVFDNESDVVKKLYTDIEVDGNKLEKYQFVDSKSNTMIQLSDIAISIIAKYLHFIDKNGTPS